MAFLDQIIGRALAADASDIYLEVGQPPGARVRGEIVRFRFDRIQPADAEAAAGILLNIDPTGVRGERVTAFVSPEHGRLRVTAYRTQGAMGLVMRPIPSKYLHLSPLVSRRPSQR